MISAKRVVYVEIKGANKPAAVLEGEAASLLIKANEEEQSMLEAHILVKKNRVAELHTKIQALKFLSHRLTMTLYQLTLLTQRQSLKLSMILPLMLLMRQFGPMRNLLWACFYDN
ncbi:hypothetical protein LIER_20730 [Lithospermum erythrorhizon]|uniref:Uncharacterized protein n=1 Tax=Lithospermum erythrorhizon TaxID=34254 RepID=A0AAV3QQP5_LITER